MRQSFLFTKTRKEAPADEAARNASLLIRGGFVHKEMAGVYAYLPLGLRVLEKIKQIVREEMDAIGSQELIMTSLQRKELWEGTDRWSDEMVDVWFKSELKAGGEVGFGWSHEEPVGNMMRSYINSYKDVPVTVYQFQTKLRNELRAKSGVMRGREFVMKDAYSFAAGEADHTLMYEQMKVAYMNVFRRVGLGDDTYITFAAGGAFTEFSHEFQTVCEAGEDVCYIAKEKGIAVNEEVMNDATLASLGVTREELVVNKTDEVGNIFNFGSQKAADLNLTMMTETGESVPVWMGSYGIGITRLLGVIVEKYADEKGMVWPKAVAPFHVHLVGLNLDDAEIRDYANGIYASLQALGIEVLFDDRDARAGEKFADSDLIGIPYRMIVSKKSKTEGLFEVVQRKSGEVKKLSESDVAAYFSGNSTW